MDSPPESSQSRRWADYSDDEDDRSPRSYCEVLRSGTPPAARTPVPSPAPVSSRPASPPARATPPRRRARSPPPAPPVGGPRPWTHGGGSGQKRHRGAQLPAWTIRPDLPPDLAGCCFNCAKPGHISRDCPNDTACLRCKERTTTTPRTARSRDRRRRWVVCTVGLAPGAWMRGSGGATLCTNASATKSWTRYWRSAAQCASASAPGSWTSCRRGVARFMSASGSGSRLRGSSALSQRRRARPRRGGVLHRLRHLGGAGPMDVA